jgi:8-oxo-dGTP pyrophosphatase MutT (NUDIX family)
MTVRAAGGVVWRAVEDGDIEVLVVHRPRYDDWTFPKGKADPGESDEDCALREVTEETGLSCDLGPYLTGVGYTDRLGRGKTARYWAMRPVGGAFEPNSEVDEVRWLRPDDAARLLTYERDRPVLLAFRSLH